MPIELALSQKEHFEDSLDKFINNETVADDELLILLLNALQRADKHRPYHERPLKMKVIDQAPTSENIEILKTPKQEEDLYKVTLSVVELITRIVS